MASVRRGAGAILRYLTPLLALAVLVQIFLAGAGVFGIEEGQGLEEATSLDPHRVFGHILTQPVALLTLIIALLWWPRNKRLLGLYVLLFVLFVVQLVLAWAPQWVAALHPVNAVVILGLLGYLSYVLWRRRDMVEDTASSVAAGA